MAKGDILYKKALEEAEKDDPNNLLTFNLLERSLKLGNAKAAYALGNWYFHGKYVEKNIRKGIELFKLAASENNPDALYDLAVSYEVGVGVKKSLKSAFECYLRAALEGHTQAIYEVGRLFYFGIGVQKNVDIAYIWQDKGRELGAHEGEDDIEADNN